LEEFLDIGILIFGTILPFAVIIISNCIIIFRIKQAARERQKLKQSEKMNGERNLTVLLLMTSLAYLVCSSPLRIYNTLAMYDLNDPYWRARYSFEWWICAEVWHLNFAMNFYIYFLAGGRRFRRDVKSVLLKCCCRHSSPKTPYYTDSNRLSQASTRTNVSYIETN
jgi:hypothetical protein